MGLFDFLTYDIAIDLGTANTLIIHNDKVVVDAPSIVAMDRTTNAILAIGHEAMQMHGKTHENIRTVRPLKDGVIADFVASEHMIREMARYLALKKAADPCCAWSSVFLRALPKWRGCSRLCRACQRQRSLPDSRTHGRCYRYRGGRFGAQRQHDH